MSDSEEKDAAASAAASESAAPLGEAAAPLGEAGAPKKRKRKRRRGKRRGEGGDAPHVGAASDRDDRNDRKSQPPTATPALAETLANLTAGLFSHLDDRHEPCRIEGCHRTWTWTAAEQIQTFGQPPPKRMCREHAAQFEGFEDKQVPCANPGCTRTWKFAKAAQIAQAERSGSAEPPKRVCDDCVREERQLSDREVACRLDACKRTWTWSRDAQLKHRTWMRRHGDELDSFPPEPAGRKRRRKNRRKASIHDPPPRLCEPCRAKLARLVEREGLCKVHGCTKNAMVDKEQQLRAWAMLGTDDLEAEAPLPRRMCESCREFCRTHPDREVPCGRPGCSKSWTYKTGAQLQAMLAGRHEDPIRLCPECSTGDFVREADGAEVMPCVVPLCDGIWYHRPGTPLASASFGDLPVDRMCPSCRAARGIVEDVRPGDAVEQTLPNDPAVQDSSVSVNDPAPPRERDRPDGASASVSHEVDAGTPVA